MDKLSHLILQAVEEGKWRGIKAGRTGPEISHLMFADDLLLFGTASDNQMKCMLEVLKEFCQLSGQEVSQEKTSLLFSRNVDRGTRNNLIQRSGFSVTNEFGKYLGVPLVGRAPKRHDFNYLIEQVSSKLAAWKATQLSFAGRLTLAKSVIEAVPTYPMMSSKIPKAYEIQRIQRNFLWGDTDQKRRYHAVKWDTVTTPKWSGGLGLRKLVTMNQACLMKLNWKFHSNNNNLWCSVLKVKYVDGRANGLEETRSTDSTLWKSLVALNTKMEEYSVWSVRDEAVVDAWNDAWVEPHLHIDKIVNIPDHLKGFKVKDLVDQHGGWNWSLFHEWLPKDIQNKIAAILPPNMENGQDERCSVGGNKKGFAISIMYQNLCGFNKEAVDPNWSRIWKIAAPERVKTFLWLVLHNRLLTNDCKAKMGLGHAMCEYCHNNAETVIHVLRDCPIAMNFWNHALPVDRRGIFYFSDTCHWIESNICNTVSNNNGTLWCTFWAMACYSLWTWRNMEMHDENYLRPAMAVQFVWKRVEEYNVAASNNDEIMDRDKVMTSICWKPPKPSFVSLNTDGASKKQHLSGCGGIVRGSQGEWIGGFAKNVGSCNAFVAELWGVLEGLRFVQLLGFKKIELNIDSIAVVRIVQTGMSHSTAGNVLVEQINKMMALDWEVEVRHTYREANKCADALANYGCMGSVENKIFDCCPEFIKDLFVADSLGITTPRIISV
jgi:ribonuclease HI